MPDGAPQRQQARPIYFDHNASMPMPRTVVEAMLPHLSDHAGNPSSGHWAAQGAKQALELARGRVAAFLGSGPEEIVFTGGGTEANNAALKGLWFAPWRRGSHIISSQIEHEAILKPLRFLRSQGARVTLVPVDRFGRVDPETVRRAIRPETALISIMHANNEVGTLQPIREIAEIGRQHGVLVHTDAAQSAGKLPFTVDDLGVDLLSLAGHKIGAPKGIGALYVRDGIALAPLLHGAGHEGGRRAGTESALLASGFGAAVDEAQHKSPAKVRQLRDYFWRRLQETFGDDVVLNGHPTERVANTLNVGFRNQIGSEILARLDGVAASTGSACHAGCVDMSYVLIAMSVPVEIGLGAVRFSLGDGNTQAEVDAVIAKLRSVLG